MCTKKGFMYFVGWISLVSYIELFFLFIALYLGNKFFQCTFQIVNIVLVLSCVIVAILPEATLEELRRQYPYEYQDNILLNMERMLK